MTALGVPPSTMVAHEMDGYRTGLRAHRPVSATAHQPRPFPLEPLRRELEHQVGDHVRLKTLAGALGADVRQVQRWTRSGLTEAQADEMAARIGRLPFEIWPHWYEAMSELVEHRPRRSSPKRRSYLPPKDDPGHRAAVRAMRERRRARAA